VAIAGVHDDAPTMPLGPRLRLAVVEFQLVTCRLIVRVNSVEVEHEKWDEQEHEPRAASELADHDDHGHRTCHDSTGAIDGSTPLPAAHTVTPPVADHAGLRLGAAEDDYHRVQRDECMGAAAAADDEPGRQRSDHDDAV